MEPNKPLFQVGYIKNHARGSTESAHLCNHRQRRKCNKLAQYRPGPSSDHCPRRLLAGKVTQIRNKAECQTSMGEDLQVVPRLQMSAGRQWGDLCFVRPGHKDRRGRGSATDARVDSEENAEERMFPVLRVSPISKKQCNRVLVARTQSIVTASACFIDKNSITHQQDQSKDTVRTCTFNSRFWDTAVMVGQ